MSGCARVSKESCTCICRYALSKIDSGGNEGGSSCTDEDDVHVTRGCATASRHDARSNAQSRAQGTRSCASNAHTRASEETSEMPTCKAAAAASIGEGGDDEKGSCSCVPLLGCVAYNSARSSASSRCASCVHAEKSKATRRRPPRKGATAALIIDDGSASRNVESLTADDRMFVEGTSCKGTRREAKIARR